jgi:hypothetical protein
MPTDNTKPRPESYIVRVGPKSATLVDLRPRWNEDYSASYPHEERTDYVAYRGNLCREWNLNNGQGSQFQEVCAGLRHIGLVVTVGDNDDVAKIIQREAFSRFGDKLSIRELDDFEAV